MSCPIGNIELYYEDGECRKCSHSEFDSSCLRLTRRGFKCCPDNIRSWECERITSSGNISNRRRSRGLKTVNLDLSVVIDRFKLSFFKRQILEEVEKVRADTKVA